MPFKEAQKNGRCIRPEPFEEWLNCTKTFAFFCVVR